MVIAALSLYFTISAQRTDLQYKEVSIQPRVTLNGSNEDFSFNLRNVGLGPGVVSKITIKSGGKCISSDGKTFAEWNEIYVEFVKELLPIIYDKSLPAMPWTKNGKKKYDIQSDVLVVGDVIPVGEARSLIRLDPGTMRELLQVESTELVVAKQLFANNAYDAPIKIRICSATGRTCGVVGEAAECDEHTENSAGGLF
jgi:hypothetical protein